MFRLHSLRRQPFDHPFGLFQDGLCGFFCLSGTFPVIGCRHADLTAQTLKAATLWTNRPIWATRLGDPRFPTLITIPGFPFGHRNGSQSASWANCWGWHFQITPTDFPHAEKGPSKKCIFPNGIEIKSLRKFIDYAPKSGLIAAVTFRNLDLFNISTN